MKTALRIGGAVSPRLGEGDANGPGANALVTTYLRAGAYRAAVTAKDSAGHLGLSVSAAALTPAAKITDAGETRATLGPGKGAVAPFEIGAAGAYRIALAGLGHDWNARLEDADGWPLTAPGPFKNEIRRVEPGAYRLVVSPTDVEARMIARLSPIVASRALEGHGPHLLPFDKAQKLQWREPQAKDVPRAPDVWRFTLQGDSDIELDIGEGMIGDVFRSDGAALGKVVSDRPLQTKLAAGDYRVEARSLAHDDRLDYEITLSSAQLQPGAPQRVDLPARLAFNLARDSVVDLSTFGDKETIGALKTEAGEVVERLEPRADDWNVALSRRLPAGAYSLELEELGATRRPPTDAPADAGAAEDSDEETAADEGAVPEAPDDSNVTGVEVKLSVLEQNDGGALGASGEATLSGGGARRVLLPTAPANALLLVTAHSTRDVALSIERRAGDGEWRTVGAERGVAPLAAWPIADEKSEWRATVWPVGGGTEPITIAARVIETRARSAGDVDFEPIAGLNPQLCVAKIETPNAALVAVDAPESVMAGSAPGRLLRNIRPGVLAPQTQQLWLVTRNCKNKTRVAAFEWRGEDVTLDIDDGEHAFLPPLEAIAGKTRLWLLRSTFTQPGVDAGHGVGVAEGAALALAGENAAHAWNASGSAPMRAALSAIDVETRPVVKGGQRFSLVIPPMTAQPVEMDASAGPLAFDLPKGVAAFVDKRGIFPDDAALSRIVHGAGPRTLLVNLSAAPLPATISRLNEPSLTLDSKTAFKRFFGVAGQVSIPLAADAGDRLVVIGADASVLSQNGRRARGHDIALEGPGEIVIDYKPGLVAAWIEHKGAAPWPQPEARALTLPQRVALGGDVMRFAIARREPVVLTATGSAPALVAFTQNGKRETFAFPTGVAFRHYMAGGDATLDIYAPHDGALSGAVDVSAQPVIDAHDGVNDAVAVAPGASALFSFETTRRGEVGFGVRTDPDRASVRLLDVSGKTLAEGVAGVVTLSPGRYFIEARTPGDASATTVRVAIAGLSPPSAAPPEDIVAELLDKAGLKKNK